MTAEFSVSAEELASGGLVVHVQGQVDLYVAPDLKARLRALTPENYTGLASQLAQE